MSFELKSKIRLVRYGVYEALYVINRDALGMFDIRKEIESPRVQELIKTNTFRGEMFYKKVPDCSMEQFLCVDMRNVAIRITGVELLDDDVTIRIIFTSDLNADFIIKHCRIAPRMIGQFSTDLMKYTGIKLVTFDLIANIDKPITVEDAINILQTLPKDSVLTDRNFNYIASIREENNTRFVIIE